jgi:hypothetical protein
MRAAKHESCRRSLPATQQARASDAVWLARYAWYRVGATRSLWPKDARVRDDKLDRPGSALAGLLVWKRRRPTQRLNSHPSPVVPEGLGGARQSAYSRITETCSESGTGENEPGSGSRSLNWQSAAYRLIRSNGLARLGRVPHGVRNYRSHPSTPMKSAECSPKVDRGRRALRCSV